MDSTIRHWVSLWDYLDQNFWRFWRWAAASLSPDTVAWQPIPRVASIGWNLQHLGEMLDHYRTNVFKQGGPLQQEPLLTMESGRLDKGTYDDLEAIAAYHRQIRPAYRDFLAKLSAEDLDRSIERRGRQPVTYAWAIGHIAEHESYHLGKCMLLRTLLQARIPPAATGSIREG